MIYVHLDSMDTNKNIPVVELPTAPIIINKALRTNLACALCRLYGHYSHHCQYLPKFLMDLADLCQHSLDFEITLIEAIHPSPLSSDTMSIYMMSSSTDPLVSTITDDPSDLSRCFPSHSHNLSYQETMGFIPT